MFSIRKSQNVFRDVLFHNDVSYDKKDEERLCVLSHGGKSRDSSLPRFLFHPLRHSLVSFFLAMGFYWQACISQNSITWRESVHPVMGNAREILSLREASVVAESLVLRSRFTEKENEKRFDGCIPRFPKASLN